MRDDFTQKTKDILANRVGWRCSNPNCRKLTRGPSKENGNTDIANIGVAAHICAASIGGPRYDKNMTEEERRSFDNGIWLCQSCSKLIDSDIETYTIEKLKEWKSTAENLACRELEAGNSIENNDVEIIRFYATCFDRPAFQDEIRQEGRLEDLDKALEDTILALSTGVLRTREGQILKESYGKSSITNPEWHKKIDTICDMLIDLRKRLVQAIKDKEFTYSDDGYYIFYDKRLGEWFDSMRYEIIKIFSSICKEARISCPHFPHKRGYWY